MNALCLVSLLLLPTTAPSERGALEASIARFNAHAQEPLPKLNEKQLRVLLRGEVVGIYREPEGKKPGGAVGMLLSRRERERLWLGIRDPHMKSPDSLVEHHVGAVGQDGVEHWYQHLRLPWPFGARHWLVRSEDNLALARRSDNQAWERRWRLAANGEARCMAEVKRGAVPGLSVEEAEEAIYTPANHGSWALIEQPSGKTLLGFQVTTLVGGLIPDHLVARYAVLRMDEVLKEIEEAADIMHQHYTAGHRLIPGGDGVPLAPFPRPPDTARSRSSQ
jgi:hypothetical protein